MPRIKGDTRAKRTPELYHKLKESHREDEGNHHAAAKAAGCSYPAAKRAYEAGWPEFTWAPPIKVALQQDGVAVRANMQSTEDKVKLLLQDEDLKARLREEIRRDAHAQALRELAETQNKESLQRERAEQEALLARQEEAELAKYLRNRGRILLSAGARSLNEFVRLGDTLGRRLAILNNLPDDKLAREDPRELISIMGRYTDAVLKVGLLVQAAQAIERKAAGDPDFVLLHKQEAMSHDDAVNVIRNAAGTAELIEAMEGDDRVH